MKDMSESEMKKQYPLELRGVCVEDSDKNEFLIDGKPCHAVILAVTKDDNNRTVYHIEIGGNDEVLALTTVALVNNNGVFGPAQSSANFQRLRKLVQGFEKKPVGEESAPAAGTMGGNLEDLLADFAERELKKAESKDSHEEDRTC